MRWRNKQLSMLEWGGTVDDRPPRASDILLISMHPRVTKAAMAFVPDTQGKENHGTLCRSD